MHRPDCPLDGCIGRAGVLHRRTWFVYYHHHINTSLYLHIITSPYHNITISPYLHIITSPWASPTPLLLCVLSLHPFPIRDTVAGWILVSHLDQTHPVNADVTTLHLKSAATIHPHESTLRDRVLSAVCLLSAVCCRSPVFCLLSTACCLLFAVCCHYTPPQVRSHHPPS
jgi:hypothetical protein